MNTWTLFPADTDQYNLIIEHYDGLIAITVGDITTELTPREARHVAGAIRDAAHRETEGT
jgi:hypothetical protein